MFCRYNWFSSSNNGGAISISEGTSSLSVMHSYFNNCSTIGSSTYGGAIYFSGQNLSIFSTCGSLCSALYSGQLGQFYVSSTALMNSSSICQCSSSLSNSQFAICQSGNSFQSDSFNSTLNRVKYYGAGFASLSSSLSLNTYFNIANCSSSMTVADSALTTNAEYISSNFISNGDICTTGRVIHSHGTDFQLYSCFFQNNNCQYLMYCVGLTDGSSKITAYNCVIDHSGAISYSPVSLINPLFETSSAIPLTLRDCVSASYGFSPLASMRLKGFIMFACVSLIGAQ